MSVGVGIINVHFSSSRDYMLRMTRDAYVELASEADKQLALSLHQKLYKGSCIKGWRLLFASFFLFNIQPAFWIRNWSDIATHVVVVVLLLLLLLLLRL